MATLHRANVWSAATSVDPIKYYEIGGANLDPAVSTDDYYHMNGLYWFRPYDLRKWGSHGAAMETARGGRYVWACGADHPTSLTWAWRDSAEWMIGFSNDPGTFPETMTPVIPWNNENVGQIPATPANAHGMYEQCWLAYNPDDADGLVFYLNGEGSGGGIQHANNIWRSSDLLTWTPKIVSHITPAADNGQWASFQVTRRLGTNSWQSHGVGSVPGAQPGVTDYNGTYKWTSTNGLTYTMGSTSLKRYRKTDGTLYNQPEILAIPTYDPTISDIYYGVGDEFSVSGQRCWVCKEFVGVWQGSIARPQYLSIVPVDADGSILASPAPTRIATYPLRTFPGPNMIQEAPYLVEDGIVHIYLARGFPGHADTNANGFPYCTKQDSVPGDNVSVTFSGTASVIPLRRCTVTIGAYWSNVQQVFHDNGAGVFVGSRIVSSSINYSTGAWSVTFNAAPDGSGKSIVIRYVENNNTFTANTSALQDGGGLVEQFHDYWTHIFDATAAASHAPVGVTASCAAGVVTLSWYDALPHQNYRVYKGSTSTTQTTLVANVTGLSTTDTPTTGQQWWYKVVTLNASVETGYRVVHCYVSSASALANKHINRVIDDGGDKTKINVARLEAAISFLTARDWIRDLLFWASPDWGVKESAGHIVKVYCLGTTRLPRGGDLTFATSTTTYSASGLNGNCAAFVNAANNSFGYFGGNRFNPIRKKRQITVAAMYQRTQSSADITFAGLRTSNGNIDNNYVGTEQPGLSFSHLAGTPGTIQFMLKDDNFGVGARQNTATVAAASAAYGIAIGTYDGADMKAYHNGTGGTANSNYDPNPFHTRDTVLAGAKGGSAAWPVLGVGSKNCSYTAPTNPPSRTAGTYVFPANEAQFKSSDIIVLSRGVDTGGAAALTGLLDGFAAPVLLGAIVNAGGTTIASASWNIVADGVTDNRTLLETARAWGIANVTTATDRFVLTLPAGTIYISGTGGNFYVAAASETSCVHNMTIKGQGQGITILSNGAEAGATWSFGTYATSPVDYWGEHAARKAGQIATVNRGSTTVRVLNLAHLSYFTVGRWALVAGLDVQAFPLSAYGYPVSPAFHDYVKITAIDSGTGVVSFTPALKYDYKSTWPEISAYNPGPAAMMPLPPAFDLDLVVEDLTITQGGGGTKCDGRSITFHNVTVDSMGLTPSQNMSFVLDHVTHNPSVEMDKLVDHFLIKDSTTGFIQTQSSSFDLIELQNSTVSTLQGTPKRFVCRNSTIPNLRIGTQSYGASDSADIGDSTVATITADDDISTPVYERCGAAIGNDAPGVNNTYDMVSGVIKVPSARWITNAVNNGSGKLRLTVGSTTGIVSGKYMIVDGLDFTSPTGEISQTAAIVTVINSTTVDFDWPYPGGTYSGASPGLLHVNNPHRWAIPGKNLIFRGAFYVYGAPFHVTDVVPGDGCIDVHTNLSGTWPAVPLASGVLGIMVHGCPSLTLFNVTGHHLYDQQHAKPAGTPIYSHYNRTFNGSTQNFSTLFPRAWGRFVEFEVNVIVPYTGGGALTFYPFSNFTTYKNDFSSYTWSPEINAKIAGVRRVTLNTSGVPVISVGSGISGDIGLAPPEAVMCTGGPGAEPRYSANPGGAANVSIEVTIKTDQEITRPVGGKVAPLWLRV